MGIWIRSARAAAITGGGPTQDITISSIGTPKFCLVRATRAVANDTNTAEAAISWGAADGTRNKVAAWAAKDADTSPFSQLYAWGKTDKSILLINPTDGTVDGEATITMITDGVQVSWSNLPAAAYFIEVVMFGGDIQGYVQHHNVNSNQLPVDVEYSLTGFGFEVDCAFFGGCMQSDWDSGVEQAPWICAGHASLVNGITQNTLSLFVGEDVSNNADLRAHMSDDRCMISQQLGSTNHEIEVTGRHNDGLKITPRVFDAVLGSFWCLGMRFLQPGGQAYCTTVASVNATTVDVAGFSFDPICVFSLNSILTALNTDETGTNGSCFGIGASTENEEFACAVTWRDGVATSDANSRSDTAAIRGATGTGSSLIKATRSLFDPNLARLSYSTATAGRMSALMLIGQPTGLDRPIGMGVGRGVIE